MTQSATGCLDTALLRRATAGLGLELDERAVALLDRYAAEIVSANRRLNLTRMDTPEGLAVGHFADSLAGLLVSPSAHEPRMVDVGAGAGLPGLPVKIARPTWSLTMVESIAKKAQFLVRAVAALGLEGCAVVCARAEDVGQDPSYREQFDLGLARAVASLPVVVEYALPLLRLGGQLVAYRGGDAAEQLAGSQDSIRILGGRLLRVQAYRLPTLHDTRHLIVVEKVAATPKQYPRRAGVPQRRPLRGT